MEINRAIDETCMTEHFQNEVLSKESWIKYLARFEKTTTFFMHTCPIRVQYMSNTCPIHVQYMSNTCPVGQMDILGVRSCPIDRWRKLYKLQILHAAVGPYNVCVGQPSTHVCCLVLKRSKKGLHFTHYFSIGLSDMTRLPECPSDSDGVYWTTLSL